jgi:hypothetical protein
MEVIMTEQTQPIDVVQPSTPSPKITEATLRSGEKAYVNGKHCFLLFN